MSSNEDISVSGILNFDEFKKFNDYHSKKVKTGFFFTTLIIFTLTFFSVIDAVLFMQLLFALLFSLIPAGLILGITKFGVHIRSSRMYKSDQLIKSEIIYIFGEDGINQKIRRSNNHFEWNKILSVYEHQDMFVIYVSKNKSIVLPMRFFETEHQKELFKQIVSDNATTPKIKWL